MPTPIPDSKCDLIINSSIIQGAIVQCASHNEFSLTIISAGLAIHEFLSKSSFTHNMARVEGISPSHPAIIPSLFSFASARHPVILYLITRSKQRKVKALRFSFLTISFIAR